MAEDVRITNLPNSGSTQAVALELWKSLRGYLGNSDAHTELELFAECLKATSHNKFDATKFK